MTSSQGRPLTRSEIVAFGAEVDELRNRTVAALGENDARYVRRIRDAVRWSELGGRALLFAGILPPAWTLGTLLLGLSKILENMELGHNVMHGQYDWMQDPEFHSQTYDWDNACSAAAWRHSHNYLHHTFTNVVGRDRDVGYGFLRLFPEQPWHPAHLLQPAASLLLALGFEWGVALHDLELERVLRGEKSVEQLRTELKPVLRKARRQLLKDYAIFPLLAGPFFVPVLAGNLAANVIRNLWAFAIIFCGHFTERVETFPESVLENETRGEWYLRQLKASSNLDGGRLFHIMSGNLSHQIEHHLFPDVPANRYAEMAVEVKRIAGEYGQHYNTGSFARQLAAAMKRIVRYALPNAAPVRRAVDIVVEHVRPLRRVEAWWAWRSWLGATHEPYAGRASLA
jgi:fatty acid desaturase